MDFSMEEFVNVIIPFLLIKNTAKYYVKGGRVYDIYFKSSFKKSLDWDIIGTRQFVEYIENELRECASSKNLILKKIIIPKEKSLFNEELIQFGFQHHYYDDSNDPFFMDIIVVDEVSIKKYSTLDGLNIMILDDFFYDLITTQKNRYRLVKKIINKNVDYFIKNSVVDYKKFIKEKEEYLIDESFYLFKMYVLNKTRKYPSIQEILIESLNFGLNFDEFNFIGLRQSVLDYIVKNITHPKQYKKISLLPKEQTVVNILYNLTEKYSSLINNLVVNARIFNKFIKTRKRYESIIKYTWNDLTDSYKLFLLLKCNSTPDKKEPLFKISKECKSYLDCATEPKIVKNTDECITDEEGGIYLEFENYFKLK